MIGAKKDMATSDAGEHNQPQRGARGTIALEPTRAALRLTAVVADGRNFPLGSSHEATARPNHSLQRTPVVRGLSIADILDPAPLSFIR
jgi:hypothetical protein